MAKCISDKCDICNFPENAEFVIMSCGKYNSERNILYDKIYELGWGWYLKEILGVIESMRECCKVVFTFLKDTGLDCMKFFFSLSTWSLLSPDVTRSGAVGGGIHL